MAEKLNAFPNGQKTISTKSAKVFIQRNGQNLLMAECTSFKATLKKNKEKVQTLGTLGTQHKMTGWEGTGSIGGYIVNSDLLKNEADAFRTGQEQRFNIVTNYYGDEEQGKQSILVKSVSLDELPLGDIKSDDGLMKFETDYTFDDFDVVETFN